jgi:hypothetical protein
MRHQMNVGSKQFTIHIADINTLLCYLVLPLMILSIYYK